MEETPAGSVRLLGPTAEFGPSHTPPSDSPGLAEDQQSFSELSNPPGFGVKRTRSGTGYSLLSGLAATGDGQLPANATNPIRFLGEPREAARPALRLG